MQWHIATFFNQPIDQHGPSVVAIASLEPNLPVILTSLILAIVTFFFPNLLLFFLSRFSLIWSYYLQEMVIDTDPVTKQQYPRYLIYDAIRVHGKDVIEDRFWLRWERIQVSNACLTSLKNFMHSLI